MVTRSIEVDLDEFSDDDIIDEAIGRDLVDEIIAERARQNGAPATDSEVTAIDDVLADLYARRNHAAEDSFRALMARFVPITLLDAYEAFRRGSLSEAICLLDRHVQPSPAAKATKLPKPVSASKPEGTP